MIAVGQLGARMHYAVPRVFHSAGLLDRFYTDLAVSRHTSEKLRGLSPRGAASLGRLAGRVIPDVSPDRITQFRLFGLKYAYDTRRTRDPSELTRIYLAGGKKFCRLILKHGLGRITTLYAFNSAALELFHHARKRGIETVLEQTIVPKFIERQLMRTERERWPGWESEAVDDIYADDYCERESQEWAIADRIICGSEFVAKTLRGNGLGNSYCAVVPYGVDVTKFDAPRRPPAQTTRVLFCGSVGLRKGIPYLMQAARLLRSDKCEFRIIGSSCLGPSAELDLRRTFDWQGSVPRTRVAEHFAWADIFVLPSICEGSATVCYEALAAGLPVITTSNAGSVVRDGIDGYIVPIRDPYAIAARLEQLISQPAHRTEMSRNARLRAQEFTVEKYGTRLLAAIEHVPVHQLEPEIRA